MNSIDKLLTEIKENRTSNSCSIVDEEFVDTDLSNMRANKLHMENVSLLSANLSKVNWRSCEIVNTCFDKANFDKAIVRMCKFINMSAKKASFNNTRLENCELVSCDFEEATFIDSSITDSDFNRSNFKGANLTNTDASYSNMRGVDFRSAILLNTNFSDADLRGADFSGAKLDITNFKGADIRGAIFDPGVMEEEAKEEKPVFSPQMQELVDVAGPFVADIIKQGVDKDLIPSEEQEKLMQQLEGLINVSVEDTTSDTEADDVIGLLFKRAGEAGIGNLVKALQDKNNTPSDEVAALIENLAKDFNLNENATTDDLLEKLVKQIK